MQRGNYGDRGRGGYGGDRGGRGGYGGDRGRGGFGGDRGGRGGFGGDRGRGGFGGDRGGRGGFGGGRGGGFRGGRGGYKDDVDSNVSMTVSKVAPVQKANFESGKLGTKVQLISNFFPISVKKDQSFHLYNLDIKPVDTPRNGSASGDSGNTQSLNQEEQEERAKKLARFTDRYAAQLLNKFFKNSGDFANEKYIFDGSKLAYLTRNIFETRTENIIETCNGRSVTFRVTLTHAKSLNTSEILEYYANRSQELPENLISFCEIATRNSFKPKYESFQSKHFDMSETIDSRDSPDIQFVNGFKSNVTPTQTGLALNVHLKTGCVLSEKYINLAEMFKQKNNGRPLTQENLAHINSLLRHLEFETKHGAIRRAYKIDKIIPKTAFQQIAFDTTTVAAYFSDKYKVTIDPDMPIVRAQSKKETFLPIQLCYLKTKQFLSNQKIGGDIQRELLLKSTNAPNVYFHKLNRVLEKISSPECQRIQQDFGLTLDKTPMQIQGRVLPTPTLRGGQQRDRYPVLPRPDLCKFSVFILDDFPNNKSEAEFVAKKLQNRAKDFGLNLTLSTFVGTKNLTTLSAVRSFCENLSIKLKGQLIVIGIPSNNPGVRSSELYNNLKFYAEREFKIVTQCFNMDTLNKNRESMSYFDNLLLKINGKLGGQNVKVDERAFTECGIKQHTMVLAYDVNHPAMGESSEKSIVACVGSMDSSFSNFRATLGQQTRMRHEMVGDLEDHVKSLVEAYRRKNNAFPTTLFFFRDGVAEGQFEDVKKIEIKSIESAVKRLGINPKIVFLVVQKIHSGRFALLQPSPMGRNNKTTYNVASGTVVDSGIVTTKYPNFYLNSHFSPLGTSKPSHYFVLKNDENFTMDQIEGFVFRSCFGCIRTKIPISIPLAVRYADLCAFRGKAWAEVLAHTPEPSFRSMTPKEKFTIPEDICERLFYC